MLNRLCDYRIKIMGGECDPKTTIIGILYIHSNYGVRKVVQSGRLKLTLEGLLIR